MRRGIAGGQEHFGGWIEGGTDEFGQEVVGIGKRAGTIDDPGAEEDVGVSVDPDVTAAIDGRHIRQRLPSDEVTHVHQTEQA
jgi:hypothetical protein